MEGLINHTIRTVSLGDSHACATDTKGNLFTWGKDQGAQLSGGVNSSPQIVPLPPSLKVTSATAFSGSTDYEGSTVFHCKDQKLFGLICFGKETVFQNIDQYAPCQESDFIGLISKEKDLVRVMVLTFNNEIY